MFQRISKWLPAFLFLALLGFGCYLIGTAVAADPSPLASLAPVAAATPQPPTGDELKAFFESIGGWRGAGALGMAMILAQGVMLILRTQAGEMLGKWRLLILYSVTVVACVAGLKIAGVDWGAALVHSQTLTALQVWAHQIFTQFIESKAPSVKV